MEVCLVVLFEDKMHNVNFSSALAKWLIAW